MVVSRCEKEMGRRDITYFDFSWFFFQYHIRPPRRPWYGICRVFSPSRPHSLKRRPMERRKSGNQLRCLNCGSIVHWTAFQCDVCGRNPREKEQMVDMEFAGEWAESESLDRRRHPRFDVCEKVIVNRSFRGELLDLCQGGAKLKTLLRLFRNQIVDLDFTVKGIPIHARARVIHVTQGVIDERYTLGVCFEAIPGNQSQLLNHHLETLSAEQGRTFCTA